jgi:membrane fusion protein, multidrug efflux system
MKTRNILFIALVLAAAGGIWAALNAAPRTGSAVGGAAGKAGAAPAVTVSTAAVKRQDVPVVLQAVGNATALSTVDLRAQSTATVSAVHIKDGDFVKAGQPLFTLDQRADRANLDKALAQQARDQAALNDLERQLKRSQELVAQNFLSQSAVDTVLSQVQSQRAAVQADVAAVQAARVALSNGVLRAPGTGRVGAINAFVGSLVTPAGNPLVTITQMSPIAVSFAIPESQLQSVLTQYRAGAVSVEATSQGGKPVNGRLSFIDSVVDPASGGAKAKAQFDNPELAIWPGQFVNVRLTVNTFKDAPVVPLSAVVTNTEGKLVYIIDADSTAQVKKIQVLYESGQIAAISGLAGGERIVVEGKQNLRAGSKVREAAARAATEKVAGQP